MERRNEVEPAGGGPASGLLARFIEITAVLDHRRPESAHGQVFGGAVPVRNINDGRDFFAPGCKRNRLPMIAARRRDYGPDGRGGIPQMAKVYERASNLEGSYGSVILVLDPELG